LTTMMGRAKCLFGSWSWTMLHQYYLFTNVICKVSQGNKGVIAAELKSIIETRVRTQHISQYI
jgi:hypothetical protein